MEWIEFGLAMLLFFGAHRVPAALGVKDRLVSWLGAGGYMVAFSLVSTGLLLWVIWAAGRAPFVPIWDQTLAARWGVNIGMPVVIALTVFGVAAPNPFAFEGRETGFDPLNPGIAGVTRQPLLWALLIWSALHLWANGDLAHVILFGSFALFSAIGMHLLESRRKRQIGAIEWGRLTPRTRLIPFAALLTGRWRPQATLSWPRLGVAVVVWILAWGMHLPVIGVSPAP